MSDPAVTLTAIQSHTTALTGTIHRHSANAACCRAWSAGMVVAVIVFGAGKPSTIAQAAGAQAAVLPWVAGVVGLLAVADACCVALARRAVEAYNRFMARVPLHGGPSTKAQAGELAEWLVLPGPDLGIREAGSVLRALGSFSVWPFHAGLLALVVAFYLVGPAGSADERAAAAKSSSGPGKPLPATSVLSAPTPRPAQTGGNAPFPGNTAKPAGTAILPRQTPPPGFIPAKPGTPPPAVRLPAVPPNRPPNRPPQNAVPQNGVPSGSVPADGVPPAVVPPNGIPANAAPVNETPPNGIPAKGTPPNTSPAPAPGAGGTPALQPAPGAGETPALQPAPAPR